MRALIAAFGTRGDVQPMVALAQALLARGHAVTLGVPPNSLDFARGFGLDAFAVGLDYEEVSRRGANGSLREMFAMMPVLRGEVQVQLGALEERAAQADIIVGSSVFAVGTILAERLGKPYVFFAYCPQLFYSEHHPSPMISWQTLPRWLNRLSWSLHTWSWNLLLRGALDQARAERGLARVRDVWAALVGQMPVVACDPALAQVPGDFSIPITQIGAMFVREQDELSPGTRAFLEAGPPPVYIGFGSMSDPDPRRTAERLLESIRRAGVRALVSRGWAGLSAESPPPEVLLIGPEPHGKLFPRCAAVVHHGGAGTTHAAARAGVPQVVMPQLLDQHYWAHRVQRLGICPTKVPRYGQDPEPLARALRACLDDAELRARAREVGAAMRTDGAEQAAVLLERAAGA